MIPQDIREGFNVAVRHHSMPRLESRPNVACHTADILARFFRTRLLEEGC